MHDNNDQRPPGLRRIDAADRSWLPTTPTATGPHSPTSNDKPPSDSPARILHECGCDGSGYYLLAVPYGHAEFGKLQRCSCGRTIDSSKAARRLGDELGGLAHCTFTTFATDRPLAPIYQLDGRYHQNLSRVPFERRSEATVISVPVQETCLHNAYADARAYADRAQGWLCFHGAYGAGKSHLAAAIAHVCVADDWAVRYRSVPGLLDAIKEGFKDGSADAVFNDVLGADLLILDDLGAQHLTGWSYERLFRLLNERQDRPTIITTNVHPDDLADGRDVDAARLADRIAGSARKIWMPISSYRRAVREVSA